MNKRKAVKICSLFVLMFLAGTGSYYTYKNIKKPEINKTVFAADSMIEYVKKTEMKETITATGTVSLAEENDVYAEGEQNIVKNFMVEEGDTVTIGQLLVEYDVDDKKEELEKKIKETQTQLENEELNLKNLVLPKTESELLTLNSNVTKAEKSLFDAQTALTNYDTKISQQEITIQNAQKDMQKAEKTVSDNSQLLDIGAITQTEYNDSVNEYDKLAETYEKELITLEEIKTEKTSAELNVKTCENALAEAQNNVKLAQDVFSDEATVIKYKQQENQIKLTKISLEDYKKQLNDLVYQTNSKVSGQVTEICIDEGTYTEENTVMLKIADFNKLIVNASIAEYDAPNIELGQKVEMTSDGLEGKLYTGTVTKIEPSASSASTVMGSETVVPIEISVDNPDGILKPGYNLDLEIIKVDKQDILAVSASAVLEDKESEESYVYKLDENRILKKTVVETGISGDVNIEILSGLNEGDKIIASPTDNMKDGMSFEDIQNSEDKDTAIKKQGENNQNNNFGGEKSDRNNRTDQMLPPGGAGGNGSGGGFAPSR